MWVKVLYTLNDRLLNNDYNEQLECGLYETFLLDTKKHLNIPNHIDVIYDFLHYIKYKQHQFFSCYYVPDILHRLIQKEYNTKYTLNYIHHILSHDIPFVKWLKTIYSIPNEPFKIYLIYS